MHFSGDNTNVGAFVPALPAPADSRDARSVPSPSDGPCGVLPLGLLRQWAEVDLLPGGRAKAESEKVSLGEITLESSWWLSQSSSARSMPLTPYSSG